MRIRSIKPEWLEDERLAECSSDARVLSVALLLLADDYGRGRLGKAVAARCFPTRPALFEPALAELSGWYLREYEVRGQHYFEVRNWGRHQKVDHPGKPTSPEPYPEVLQGPSREPRESLARLSESVAPDQDQDQEGKGTGTGIFSHTAHEDPESEWTVCRVGNEFMLAINCNQPWSPIHWRKDLETIGGFPATQRATALTTIRASRWCQINAHMVNPGHVVKYWNKYASGRESVTQVLTRGPTAVPTQTDYAADAALGDAAWET